jgi:hypothetical protein
MLQCTFIQQQLLQPLWDNGVHKHIYYTWNWTAAKAFNSFQAIRVFAVRVTPIFTNKKHALNTLKMAPLLRSDVMLS